VRFAAPRESRRLKAGSATPSGPKSFSRGLRRCTAFHSRAAPFCVIPAQSIASARERRIARASHGQNL
jgi:hypothetical protein